MTDSPTSDTDLFPKGERGRPPRYDQVRRWAAYIQTHTHAGGLGTTAERGRERAPGSAQAAKGERRGAGTGSGVR